MAKTNRPLTILVHKDLWNHPEVQDLRKKGSYIHRYAREGFVYDLVLGPSCWRIVPGMEDQQIPLAIKAARKVRYGKKAEENEE